MPLGVLQRIAIFGKGGLVLNKLQPVTPVYFIEFGPWMFCTASQYEKKEVCNEMIYNLLILFTSLCLALGCK